MEKIKLSIELELTEVELDAYLRHLRFRISSPANKVNDVEFTSVLEQIFSQLGGRQKLKDLMKK